MNIGIYGHRPLQIEHICTPTMKEWLNDHNVKLWTSKELYETVSKYYSNTYTLTNTTILDILFSLGGDGTLLDAVHYIGSKKTPILGINTGRMGFLSTCTPEELLPLLQLFVSGTKLDERIPLELRYTEKREFALNDIVLMRLDHDSIIEIRVTVEQSPVITYWADGLIIATPTGSTAYSLSCGGPIVMPQSKNIILTPISPHNLSTRPLVLPDHSTLQIKVFSRRSKQFSVNLDGRRHYNLSDNTSLDIQSADYTVQLLHPPKSHIFDTLRKKLNWGVDVRNRID